MKISTISIVLAIVACLLVAKHSAAVVQPSKRSLATCPDGSIADSTGKFCCPGSCGLCGGSGCDKRPGGASTCCTSQIKKSCGSSSPPCIASKTAPPTLAPGACPVGSIADSTGLVCCPSSCGQCGGSGCHLRTGGATACCTSQITKTCTGSQPPCKISGKTPAPTTAPPGSCPVGSIADSTGLLCCPASCGQCGGSGCHLRIGGASACCTSQITKSCTGNQPPCRVTTSSLSLCANGILESISINSACAVDVCCPKSCGVCNTSNNCTAAPECCAYKIAQGIEVSDVDVSCRYKGPPCVMPPSDDPCTPTNPCQHGARCGYAWQSVIDYPSNRCIPRTTCECDEVGNYSGSYCELTCGVNETPCGYYYHGYTTNIDEPNNVCCADTEECLGILPKYGRKMECFPKDRPVTCDPNPCQNGGNCSNYNYYDSKNPIFLCACASGFEGVLCENAVN